MGGEGHRVDGQQFVNEGLKFLSWLSESRFLESGSRESAAKAHAGIKRQLESRTLRLAIVGEFSSGKSTLINSLLGQELLAADIEPTTAVATRLTWSPSFQVRFVGNDGDPSPLWPQLPAGRSVLMHALRQLRTGRGVLDEMGNLRSEARPLVGELIRRTTTEQEGAKGIREVILELNSPYLAPAIDLIDTPGFNPGLSEDRQQAHRRVTVEAVESSHLALFVLDGRNPLKQTERKYFELFEPFLSKVIFAVNKMDVHDEDEAEDTEDYVRTELARVFGVADDDPLIYFVSSLDAKGSDNAYRRELDVLRDALVALMQSSRQRIVVQKTMRSLKTAAHLAGEEASRQESRAIANLQVLESHRITDPQEMAGPVRERGLAALRAACVQGANSLPAVTKSLEQDANIAFQARMERVAEKKDVSAAAKKHATSVANSEFRTPFQTALRERLGTAISNAQAAMRAEFASMYADIDVAPPPKPSKAELQRVVAQIITQSVSTGRIGAAVDSQKGAGDIAAGVGAVAAGVLGAVLLGPVGIALAGGGARAMSDLFSSLDKLRETACREFSVSLSEQVRSATDASLACLSGDNPAFGDLVDKYAAEQVAEFDAAVRGRIAAHQQEMAELQADAAALREAARVGQEWVTAATAHAEGLRRELRSESAGAPLDPRPWLGADDLDRLADRAVSAVAAGAWRYPDAVEKLFHGGEAAHLAGSVSAAHTLELAHARTLRSILKSAGAALTSNRAGTRPSDAELFGVGPLEWSFLTGSPLSTVAGAEEALWNASITDGDLDLELQEVGLPRSNRTYRAALADLEESARKWEGCLPKPLARQMNDSLASADSLVTSGLATLQRELFMKVGIGAAIALGVLLAFLIS